MTSLHRVFGQLSDPRLNRKKAFTDRYSNIECPGGTLRGAIMGFHRTFRQDLINSRHFERLFIEWPSHMKESGKLDKVIAIDGKSVRGSRDSFHGKSPIHPVHAWSVEQDLCLGQWKTELKSNEITAIPELLDLLEVKGCIISVDAMGTQTCIAEKIISKGADYNLAVKDNQKSLREEVEAACKKSRPVCDLTETKKGHGRIETRRCRVFEKGFVDDLDNKWIGSQTVIEITATREIREKVTTEKRYYISSLDTKAPFNQYIREHWGVENSLHWTLDMVFREDDQRKRDKRAAENFAIVRKIFLNLLKKDKATKGNLVSKRLRAGWDKDYLLALLKF